MINDKNRNWSMVASMAAFLIGVILLWSFGKYWLHFESAWVFLAGLLGVAIPVLIFGLWKVYAQSDKNPK